MTVLVTGGTGFIGAEVVRLLLAAGEKRPVVFDIDPSTARLADVADQVELVRGDLGEPGDVMSAVESARPDVIYHLGGMLTVRSDADPAAALRANALGTFHVLEAARRSGVRHVLFSSSIATYGADIREESVGDYTLQRPVMFYGATKLFGEHMGLFFKRKHGLDFRGIRYPSVVGPGVATPSVSQYTSRVIEESARGNPYTVFVRRDTRAPVIYYRDAARAMVKLGEALVESIVTVNYVIAGVAPTPTAGELADAVRARVPDARIDFKPDPEVQAIMDRRRAISSIDDSNARKEWGWRSEYTLEQVVEEVVVGSGATQSASSDSDTAHGAGPEDRLSQPLRRTSQGRFKVTGESPLRHRSEQASTRSRRTGVAMLQATRCSRCLRDPSSNQPSERGVTSVGASSSPPTSPSPSHSSHSSAT